MKRTLVLILSLTLAGAFAVASQARTANSSAQRGALHAIKECSQYNGRADSFCTIVGSNLPEIGAGSTVLYLEAAGATGLDSDVVLYAGSGTAFGHVILSFKTSTGSVIFTDGTGSLQGFHARVSVRLDKRTNLWHWDGAYSFG
jgi:phage protein U